MQCPCQKLVWKDPNAGEQGNLELLINKLKVQQKHNKTIQQKENQKS